LDLEDVMPRIARSEGTAFLGNVQPALALKTDVKTMMMMMMMMVAKTKGVKKDLY
jgi:hypothetical protein